MKMSLTTAPRRQLAAVSALLAGALIPLSLAPFDIWPLGLLSIIAFGFALQGAGAARAFWMAVLFNLSLYGVGASWVYISISQFGNTSVPMALLLTTLFVIGLSFIFAWPFAFYGRFFAKGRWHWPLALPAAWVLNEWLRSWLLTGFPWLYLGYAHLHTPLAGYAPIVGVFGLGWLVAASACVLMYSAFGPLQRRARFMLAGGVAGVWLLGALAAQISWTKFDPEPISLGMAQGNIPQELKWEPSYRAETFRIFNGLSESLWQYDWVIWPEAAIPLLFNRAEAELSALDARATATDTTFITGILYDDWDKRRIYNSLIALGEGSGQEFKRRLVPFGEYVPLEQYLRGTIEFFNLPTSIIHPGPAYQSGLTTPQGVIAPTICYEVVYPDLVAARAKHSNVLLTVSNDAWFGRSIGPIQHFQMAQMRALEAGRYMVRATNNGLTGIIDAKGNTLVQGGRFTQEFITGEVHAAHGLTPFLWWGSWPVLIGAAGVLVMVGWRGRRDRSNADRPNESAAVAVTAQTGSR